jgi:hypothetical protein
MNPKRKYQLCGKKPNGKVDVIVEKTSILFASSFIEKMRPKYEKMGYMYLFAIPV